MLQTSGDVGMAVEQEKDINTHRSMSTWIRKACGWRRWHMRWNREERFVIRNRFIIFITIRVARIFKQVAQLSQRPRCRASQLWPKVEDDILQII